MGENQLHFGYQRVIFGIAELEPLFRFPSHCQRARVLRQLTRRWRLRQRLHLLLVTLLLRQPVDCAQCALMMKHEQNLLH